MITQPPVIEKPTTDNAWDIGLFRQQLRTLGARIRTIRQSHAWSQHDLGNRTQIDRSHLSRIESGRNNVTLEVLWRLASALQVHWADLLNDRTSIPPEGPRTSAAFEQQLHAFGTRAHKAQVLQRLSPLTLADRTGIGRSTIFWIEDGTKNVTQQVNHHHRRTLIQRPPSQPLSPGRL